MKYKKGFLVSRSTFMNTIVLKHNNFSNAMQSFWETLYLKNPNLGIGGVHRWIQGGKWEGGAALRPTPNYEHEVAPPLRAKPAI